VCSKLDHTLVKLMQCSERHRLATNLNARHVQGLERYVNPASWLGCLIVISGKMRNNAPRSRDSETRGLNEQRAVGSSEPDGP
jgi:hypothetical protein